MTSSDTIEKVRDAILGAGFNTWDQARAAISAYEQSGGWQAERKEIYAAMRWVYEHGMVPSPLRPQWVSNAFNAAFAYHRIARAARPTPPGAEATRTDPTQFGDDVAAEMRAYFETHKHERWQEGNADNLMLGLLNIALARYRPTPPGAEATPLLEVERLREALEPFAAMAEYLDNTAERRDAIYCGGSPGLRCEVTKADYHKARAALAKLSGSGEGKC